MVVCRFFLQNSCRYGNSCKYDHILPNYNSNVNLSLHQQQTNHPRPQQPIPGQLSSKDFCDMVQRDLDSAEKSGQWLLSCYCPFPSRSSLLPGLEDYSPEELRCLTYQAESTGNIDACRQQISKLIQDAHANRNIFKSQSPECKNILERVRSNTANSFQSVNKSGSSIFGGSAQAPIQTQTQGSLFGVSPSRPSMFGGGAGAPGNPFGAATSPQASVFGGSNPPQPSANPFLSGNAGQPSLQPASPFGSAPVDTTTAPPTQTSIFGSSFSGAVPTAQPSIFGGQNAGSVFGGGSPSINSFSFAATAQSQGLMNSPPTQQGMMPQVMMAQTMAQPTVAPQTFMAAPQAQPPPAAGSVFGGNAAGSANVFGGTATVTPVASTAQINPFGVPTQAAKAPAPLPAAQSSLYTPLGELTESERAAFMSSTFTKGCIPLRPPPKELC